MSIKPESIGYNQYYTNINKYYHNLIMVAVRVGFVPREIVINREIASIARDKSRHYKLFSLVLAVIRSELCIKPMPDLLPTKKAVHQLKVPSGTPTECIQTLKYV